MELVRFAYKSVTLWNVDCKVLSVLGIKRDQDTRVFREDRTVLGAGAATELTLVPHAALGAHRRPSA